MRAFTAAVAAMLTTACAASHSPKPPDLSGSWSIDRSATRLQLLNVENLERATLDIQQSDSALRFTRVFSVRGQENTFSYELPLDGREVATVADGERRYSRLYRDGDALVYYTRIVAPDGESTNIVHYRLSQDGTVLDAREQRRGTANYDNLWVFRRQR